MVILVKMDDYLAQRLRPCLKRQCDGAIFQTALPKSERIALQFALTGWAPRCLWLPSVKVHGECANVWGSGAT